MFNPLHHVKITIFMIPTWKKQQHCIKVTKASTCILMHILHFYTNAYFTPCTFCSLFSSWPIKQHMHLFCCIEHWENHFHSVMHENAALRQCSEFRIWLEFHGFKIRLEFEPGCDDVIVDCQLEPLMSSGSPLLSGSDFSGFLGSFSVCINCNFLFLSCECWYSLRKCQYSLYF